MSKSFPVSENYSEARRGLAAILSNATSRIAVACQEFRTAHESEVDWLKKRQAYLLSCRRDLLHELAAIRRRAYANAVRRSGAWNLSIAALLIVGAFVLALKTLEEYHLGMAGYIFAAAVASAVPYCIDRFLNAFRHRLVVRTLIVGAMVTALLMAIMFGALRGDVLAYGMTAEPAIVIDGVGSELGTDDGAGDLLSSLRMVWGVAAIAAELVAGLALFDFREARQVSDLAAFRRLESELLRVEKELLKVTQRLRELSAAPGKMEAAFWREFDRGLHDAQQQHHGGRRFVVLALGMLLAGQAAVAADRLAVVVGIDLSQTQAAPAGTRSEFDENVRTVSELLMRMPTATRIVVGGITARSYSSPVVILDARVSSDPGPFDSQLKKARRTLVSEWNKRSPAISPTFAETDIVGFLRLAGDLLARADVDRKVVILFTDARHYVVKELDLETPKRINVASSIEWVSKNSMFAPLQGIEVVFVGAGDRGGVRGTDYAMDLKHFWTAYVQRSRGTLAMFSTVRESDTLGGLLAPPQGGK